MYKIVRRPPCWKSTARLARHARLDLLDWIDKVERVESSRVESSQVEFEPIALQRATAEAFTNMEGTTGTRAPSEIWSGLRV